MEGYSIKVRECSKSLTVKEKIAIKDFSNAIALDSAITEDTPIVVSPAYYAVLDVHNEHSANDKDYTKFIIVDTSGNKYVTGSNSFFTSFIDIYNEMQEEAPGEDYSIECYRRPSQNYKGKSFLTCSII